jgi:hypothetical protein
MPLAWPLLHLAFFTTDGLFRRHPLRGLVALPVVTFVWFAGAALAGHGIFALAQALCWMGFVHAPILLLLTRRPAPTALAVLVGLVGADAFFVEPRWLEVTHTPVPGPPLRIALLADIQTDHVDGYTAEALAAVGDVDLVVFAGDYLQIRDETYAANAAALHALIAGLHPRLGGVAVRGDVDTDAWTELFDGTDIRAVRESATFSLGGITVTALSTPDSRSATPPIPHVDGFHLVVGHAPDYALARPDADLLLAGHTHGGQIRVPGFGPLATLSHVPRAWAAGRTELPTGGGSWRRRPRAWPPETATREGCPSGAGAWGPARLRRSRVGWGAGERLEAPRLRFFCRPELVILELGRTT